MKKGTNTSSLATRVPNDIYLKFQDKAARRNLTISEALRRLIEKELGIRPRI